VGTGPVLPPRENERGYDAAVTRANRAVGAEMSEDAERRPATEADRIAELEELVRQLRTAVEARGRRLVTDQLAYAEHVQAQNLVIDRLQEDVKILEAEIEGRKQAYRDLVNTKTFRYSAKLRDLYGSIRRWFRGR
jgi:hypothetical protein